MYDRILFPTDGREGAYAVFDHVLDMVAHHEATLHILYVADTTHDSVTRIGGGVVDVLEQEGQQIVQEFADQADRHHVPTVTDVLQGGVPATITEYAGEAKIDLIVMPTRGRTGVQRLLLGSTAERVVRQASVPVLTLHPDDDSVRYPYQNVLVPTDGSEYAMAAIGQAIDIVNMEGATLHVLSVVDVTSLGIDVHSERHVDTLEEKARQAVAEAMSVAEDAGVDSVVGEIEYGSSVAQAIQSYVDERDIDIVVMGTHGRTGVDRYLLGSVTEKTLRTANVSLLTVPEPRSVLRH